MTEPGGWTPDEDTVERANLTRFMAWLAETGRGEFGDYHQLQAKSVDDIAWFWDAVWHYFDIRATTPTETVLAGREMPGAQWFPGSTLNYAVEALRHETDKYPALVVVGEDGTTEWSWARLRQETAAFANYLRRLGVKAGDRVVGYLPNIGEAVAAFMGAASVGATWAVCNPDLAVDGVIARLGQLEPAVLVACDGSVYGGKRIDRSKELAQIRRQLPTLKATVLVSRLGDGGAGRGRVGAPPARRAGGEHESNSGAVTPWSKVLGLDAPLEITPVPFDHPLWVLYSSGTTGLPKAIVQSQGGILLEHLKQTGLHLDLGPDDRFFWYTSTGWMMWNFLVSGLLAGATVVLYDGSPGYPAIEAQWRVAEQTGTTVFGTSAAYVIACRKAGVHPGRDFDLSRVSCVATTGSPLPPDGFRWLHDEVAEDLWIASVSGGTDVCSCFAGGVPTLPVYIGELQAACLGTDLQAWDAQGRPVVDEVGELVVTNPMPSMPVHFWNDPDGDRYRESYFEMFPGVWRHGDWITLTSRGTVVIHGRSDSTLNRQGVRMGSADIYEVVERLPEIRESLVIGIEEPDGGYWMPLFVQLAEGAELTDELRARVNDAIRAQLSPRHVPDEIVAVPGVPHTLTGKRIEVPVKRLLQGAELDKAVNPGSVDDLDVLRFYERLGAERAAGRP
jgi:acetoacetyl-CoA synthetase